MTENKRKIIFRADGNHSIGMGHFTRSLALADMLKDDFDVVFATRDPDETQLNEIGTVYGGILELPGSNKHFDVFLNYLTGDEIVVLDNYYFDTTYQKAIKSKGNKLVCIDDMHDKHYVADTVINHSPGLSPDMFSCEKYTKLCLGLEYALLRKPFLHAAKRERTIEKIETVFICFGGSDPFDLTFKTLKIVAGIKGIRNIYVVTGHHYKNPEALKTYCSDFNHIFIHRNLDANQMANIMEQSHLAIVPASSILLEILCIKIPIITGYYADNQLDVLRSVERLSNTFSVGDFRTLESIKLKDMIENLTDNFIPVTDSLIDGKSGERLAALFRGL